MMDTRHLAQAFRAQSLRVKADLNGRTGVLIWDSRCVLIRLSAEQAEGFVRRVQSLMASGLSSRDAVDACGAMTVQDHLQLMFDFPASQDACDSMGLFEAGEDARLRPESCPSDCHWAVPPTQPSQPSLFFEAGYEQDTDAMNDNLDLFGLTCDGGDAPDLVPGVEF